MRVENRIANEAEIVWCDPPEPRNGLWKRRLAPFVERPGEWGMVMRTFDGRYSAHQTVRDLRASQGPQRGRRRRLAIPAGRWEFQTGKLVDGGWGVWARYLGPEDE